MSIGSSLGITLPTQGGNTGTWGTDLNTEIQKIIDAVEASVPSTAIDFSADVDFNSQALTSIDHAAFDALGSAPSNARSVYFNASGELVIKDGASNTIQITSGGSLNAAAANSITDTGGDYGTLGIELEWDGTRFNFKDGSGANDFSAVRVSGVAINDGSSNYCTIDAPAMAADYSLTLPAAVPASAAFLQMDTSGNLTASNTMAQDMTFNGDVTIANADVLHGSRTVLISGAAFSPDDAWSTSTRSTNGGLTLTGTFKTGIADLPVPAGSTIESVTFYYNQSTSQTVTVYLSKWDSDTATYTNIDSGSSATTGETSQTISPSHTSDATEALMLRVVTGGVTTTLTIKCVKVTYSRS